MHDFTVLVLPGAFNSSVAVTMDILGAAEAMAARAGVAPPRWRLCSVHGGPVQLRAGMSLDTTRLPVRPRDDRSTWVVPGLGLNTPGEIRRCLESDEAAKAIAALARHAKAGGQVAASCSAVFLLNAAGLLQGRRATVSWWYAPLLARMAPGCTVDADRMVCSDGPVVTAGAAFAQTDLMLHLLRERCGSALTDLVSRMLLIDVSVRPSHLETGAEGRRVVCTQLSGRVDVMTGRIATALQRGLEGRRERTLARCGQGSDGVWQRNQRREPMPATGSRREMVTPRQGA